MDCLLLPRPIISKGSILDFHRALVALTASSKSCHAFRILSSHSLSLFDNPDREERILYAKYWQKKLVDNRNISFPDTLVWTVADATDKFSFAYLKEALYVAILVFSKISLMLQSFSPLQRLNARHTRKH